ncbi:MAG TPA: DUF4234 domain-containing protein, partial [Actinomycetota bacterium]|nr:DUF4234 domain-containing protein [Actinomycetota bacterium]
MATRAPALDQEVGPRAAGAPADALDAAERWVEIEGQRYRRRNPMTEYLLVALTLGIWALVWHYRTNDDARRFLRDESIRPALSAMAFMTGMAAPVPLVVSIVLAIV